MAQALQKKRVLLKLTGTIFLADDKKTLDTNVVIHLIEQLKQLRSTYQFGIVIGGGNFFRGKEHGATMGISASSGHQVGMLATMMNGLILKDLLEQHDLQATLLCAMPSPEIGTPISQQTVHKALTLNHILVFSGGTGNPFFTTDTNAVLRSLQMNADEIWKGTNVDGVYTADPHKDANAKLLKEVSYRVALDKKLAIMDATAFALAQEYQRTIRVFDIFKPNALLNVASNNNFGSIIQ